MTKWFILGIVIVLAIIFLIDWVLIMLSVIFDVPDRIEEPTPDFKSYLQSIIGQPITVETIVMLQSYLPSYISIEASKADRTITFKALPGKEKEALKWLMDNGVGPKIDNIKV